MVSNRLSAAFIMPSGLVTLARANLAITFESPFVYCAETDPSVPKLTELSSAPAEPSFTGMSSELTWSYWVNACWPLPSDRVMSCGAPVPSVTPVRAMASGEVRLPAASNVIAGLGEANRQVERRADRVVHRSGAGHETSDRSTGRDVAAQHDLAGRRRRQHRRRYGDVGRDGRGVDCARDRVGRPTKHACAAGGHQLSAGVPVERAVTGEQLLTSAVDDEEAVALDGQIGDATRQLEGTLREAGGDRRNATAEADLHRVGATSSSGGDAAATHGLRQGVGEDRSAGLEALRVDVGDVVGRDVHHRLVATQAADGCEEGTKHCGSPRVRCSVRV